jgi:tRNA(Arg) A34 adenosine deaminase TadA
MKKFSKQESPFENNYMRFALEEARLAYMENEIPVGCVIIKQPEGKIISKAHNLIEQKKNPNFHAEIIAINNACVQLNSKNLFNCDIYVTLEPCTMCASAISNARLKRLYYAAADIKHGAVENGARFYTQNFCFHRPEIYSELLSSESSELMTGFFRQLRKNKLQ